MDFKALLALMVEKKASDLFITAGKPPSMKIDGKVIEVSKNMLNAEQSMKVVLSIMEQRQRDEFEHTKECQFAIGLEGLGRFRISAFTQRDAAGMVIRRIETNVPSSDELNLPPILKELIMYKRGLVLFVGATGTGKSTSLAALIRHRNENSNGHIITIEDPIEFVHQHKGCIIT
jgi:twitching motility protein PilU